MATFTVTTLDDVVDAGDGRLSLREAIELANGNAGMDTINFAAALEGGRVVLSGSQLTITDHLRIDGDGNGDGAGITIDAAGGSRVMLIGGSGAQVSLEDLTVTGGKLDEGDGAGIQMEGGAQLSLTRCTVTGNITGDNAFLGDGDGSRGNGAGIDAGSGNILTIVDSTISDNDAFGVGGGITAGNYTTISITNSTISGNGAYFGGGGIHLENGSTLRVESSLLSGNHCASFYEYGFGGAIELIGGSAFISRSAIVGNHAAGGGGIEAASSQLTIVDSTIAGNSATMRYGYGSGSAISAGGQLTISGSTITNNHADWGGSVIEAGGQFSIGNSIVAGNNIGYYSDGDGIDGVITSSNGHNIFGAFVAGNVAGDLENVSGSLLFADVNSYSDGGLLSYNGGPTPTVALRNALDNPALGGADPAAAGTTDQRGLARAQPGTSSPDIGAFELAQSALSTRPTAGNDVLTGTAKANTLSGLAGADLLLGLAGNDTLSGGEGSDTLRGGLGNDLLDGGNGIDTASYRDATASVTVSLLTGRSSGALGVDTLVGIESLEGSAYADTLTGHAGANTLGGQQGDDKLYGLDGDDWLYGGSGNDLLEAGFGNDVIDGGAGIDLVSWANDGGTAGVTIDLRHGLMTRGTETDILIGIENADGTANADVIYGDHLANALGGGNGADTLYGRKGDDILAGGLGNDVLDGGAGFDLASFALGGAVTVDLSGTTDVARRGTETDRLVGIEGAIGSANADRMIGDAGANLFRGGPGKDTLTGGAGRDTFDYDSLQDSPVGTGRDVITDFTRGEDRIDLSGIDANTSAAGDQAFTRWVGTGPAGTAGSLGYAIVGGNTVIHGNVDGDAAWEFEIQLTGTKVLSLADFVL
ncbi:M10 family metallopeptidase C-terminal domain-containing protein [Benzoatithermus flavus]|uniref:M10 family metallopeptidase C-terminal domain-containing protein n=1 Tax=Benzoatithermus flavus TaxID=3108223 RepID=A0ABU8XRH8_9PROT